MAGPSLRARLRALVRSDGLDRAAFLAVLTPDERRVILYEFQTMPDAAQYEPNRLPPPPFDDVTMEEHRITALLRFEAWEASVPVNERNLRLAAAYSAQLRAQARHRAKRR